MARTFAWPLAFAFTLRGLPASLETVATLASLDVQVASAVTLCVLPSSKVALASSSPLVPAASERLAGAMASDFTAFALSPLQPARTTTVTSPISPRLWRERWDSAFMGVGTFLHGAARPTNGSRGATSRRWLREMEGFQDTSRRYRCVT